MKKNKIFVVGLGFVGLTTAIGFAKKGLNVVGVEKDKIKLKLLNKNKIYFFEKNLNKNLFLVKKNKNISFTDKFIPRSGLNIVFLCLGTPANKNGNYNLSDIKNFIKSLNKYKKNKFLIIIKSTVLPGTISNELNNIPKYQNIKFCSNPEFLREGSAWNDFMKPDRIIIGAEDGNVRKIISAIYKKFKGIKIYTNFKTAEYIKILSNNLLSNLISFSNHSSIVGHQVGDINIKLAFDSVKKDKRWYGNPSEISSYFHPGLGYGGYCLPKDTLAFSYLSKKYMGKKNIISENLRVNNYLVKFHIKKILKKINRFQNICILGLSFKPDSDDIRFSKSIELIKKLKEKTKKNIILFDPIVEKIFLNQKIIKKPFFHKNNFYILTTSWKQYVHFLKKIPKNNFIDLRYVV
jgi:UDPglucose 6-dehydrogenase